MIGFERYCLTDNVRRIVNLDSLTFSGDTLSGKSFSITVKLSDANEWINGGLIQNCFSYLDKEQREILVSGNDNESWEKLFGPSDE